MFLIIEIYHLQLLLAFAESGTLPGAAKKLHTSQPSLSRAVQDLETELSAVLFEHTKNKLTLNENGKLAVECAKKIIDELDNMKQKIQSFDRMNHTINIGACASIPGAKLMRILSDTYPEMTITFEIKNIVSLLDGLRNNTYQFITLPMKPENTDGLFIKELEQEHLLFSLPVNHPLAGSESLHLSDINGQNIIVLPNLGFWEDVISAKMPDSKFLVQTDKVSFEELIRASILPSFTSNLALHEYLQPEDHVTIPILDEEVNVTFYCIAKKETIKKYGKTNL